MASSQNGGTHLRMHRIFYDFPELVLDILHHLPRPDQLHFGMTCEVLWKVAVGEVWRFAGPSSLFKLLPEEIKSSRNMSAGILEFKPLDEPQHARLLDYASHIRHFKVTDEPPSSRYLHLAEANRTHAQASWRMRSRHALTHVVVYPDGPQALLPKVESVTIDAVSAVFLRIATRLLSLPCKDVRLGLGSSKDIQSYDVAFALDKIKRSTDIGSLKLSVGMRAGDDEARLERSIASLASGLPCLRALDLAVYTKGHDFIPALASLPLLEKLSIGIHSKDRALLPYRLPEDAFPSLIALSIDSETSVYHPNSPGLLQGISSPSFAEFAFSCDESDFLMLRDVARLLSEKWPSTFQKLLVNICPGDSEEMDPPDGFYDALFPLTMCKNLESLGVESPFELGLSDENMDVLSRAWPKLRALSINEECDDEDVQSARLPTRRSLALLARSCPALEYLQISVDFNSVDNRRDLQSVSSTSMKHLNLGVSTCDDVEDAAAFLRNLFPRLETFDVSEESDLFDADNSLDLPTGSPASIIVETELLDIVVHEPVCPPLSAVYVW